MGKIEYIAVQCFQCHAFQVAQQTKTNKWNCKICNSKQTIKKIYAISFQAKDIRPIVQDLNLKRNEIEKQRNAQPTEREDDSVIDSYSISSKYENDERTQFIDAPLHNKWSKYVPKIQEDEQVDEESDIIITTTMEKKQRGGRKKNDDAIKVEGFQSKKAQRGRKRKIKNDDEQYEGWDDRTHSVNPQPKRVRPIHDEQKSSSLATYKFTAASSSQQGNPVASKWSKFVSSATENEQADDDEVITDPSAFYNYQEEYL